ncbi:cysteine synthase A [Vagococcus xieshaowenii]|uniref:Cysteine synthase n=1 Tax=Vagococcus xieshaowenii TaxID=2562451 RepID=A0A4Z0DCZ6_9ENTE|nr:cysteine synthase A [Vagococcus xieshaowenii]QCA28489.1 cysteine synthase A [Vagococcus xieshaowenii]TFZ42756.1 cysteine synthase A [Vagococcus xieshaowenii]
MRKVDNILALVGETPLVKLNHLVDENDATVYMKLEFFNPGGSVKDRIAVGMIEQAEKEGLIKPGDTIVEPTSGNTGVGLAMVAAAKGYKSVIIMPDTMSIERQKLMKAYGADLILTPGAEGMKGSIAKATELAAQDGFFMPLQFNNAANPAKHEESTGREILAAFEGEKIDAFVAGVGTGGTITGVQRVLSAHDSETTFYAVEPAESEVLRGGAHSPHKIQGIGAGFIPEVLDQDAYDEIIPVPSDDAIATGREVAQKEGILVGISAGAAINAAVQVAKRLGKGHNVVVVVPDNGERYLSTALYDFSE